MNVTRRSFREHIGGHKTNAQAHAAIANAMILNRTHAYRNIEFDRKEARLQIV